MSEERKFTLEITDLEARYLVLVLFTREFDARRRVFEGDTREQLIGDVCTRLRKRIQALIDGEED